MCVGSVKFYSSVQLSTQKYSQCHQERINKLPTVSLQSEYGRIQRFRHLPGDLLFLPIAGAHRLRIGAQSMPSEGKSFVNKFLKRKTLPQQVPCRKPHDSANFLQGGKQASPVWRMKNIVSRTFMLAGGFSETGNISVFYHLP